MPPLLARVEARTLLAFLLVAGSLWGFAALAEEVMEGDTHRLDARLLLALRDPADPGRALGPPALRTAMRDVTALGGATVLLSLTAALMAALAIRRQPRSALFLGVVVAGGQALSHGTKAIFDRPRPDLLPHATETFAASFPSGHSMMAAATWLTLAMMLARSEPQRRMKAFLIVLAALVTVAVGVSRVYLGVHWPTDVLAGWTLGTAWALLCFLLARWLSLRGGIEPERGGP
ncbi:phosphatase PAP2 family protein [Rubellimicrobium aerolatum]|uniref:Phosphatase PAP2 family protein n=1 Tax=Rubellimicrobium aerolatum TaxID=490979 RepID=A0ABW0SFA8_9RHOB|nr:phosphatase PAP2 family protein [Rubellimicrobium aerolatum]MBP1807151.1 undecaprenyl-diphosphatase [Rubellimicrobium aerolatum]